MILQIDGYTVEIKAKKWEERANKAETMELLNRIACWAGDSQQLNELRQCAIGAKYAGKARDEIHDFLDSHGCYDAYKAH